MRVLITGATGFLGGSTARFLRRNNYQVTALGRNLKEGNRLIQDGIAFLPIDLSEKEKLFSACEGQQLVIHCAALAAPFGKYENFHRANVEGTQNLIDACLRGKVRRVVNISTPSLYFDYRNRVGIRESDPLPAKQSTHYGATKLKADRIIEEATAKGMQTISLRPRAVFGPGDRTVLPRVIQAVKGGRFLLIKEGKSLVDLTYIDNLVEAIHLAMETASENWNRTYNITNGESMTVRQMTDKVFQSLGMRVRYLNVPFWAAHAVAALVEGSYAILAPRREPPLTSYLVGLMANSQTLDISEARARLGYEPRVTMEEGLRRFATSWLNQR